MSSRTSAWRAARLFAGTAVAVLLGALATAVGSTQAAAAAPAAQGLQFGQVLNMSTCARVGPIVTFLNDPKLMARTSWIRVDFKGAGIAPCNVIAAYGSLLTEIHQKAPQIQVIGLMSIDFIWGGGINISAANFGAAARLVACDSTYASVGVWEVWNEPSTDNADHTAAYLSPDRYAQLLGAASQSIRSCGRKAVTGGITLQGAVQYLQQVDAAFRADRYGGYADLSHAVDGIGLHPYGPRIGDTDAGHSPLNDALTTVYQAFPLPLYLTEFGWQITTGITEINQCHNLINSFAMINASWAPTRVVAATWFTMQDFGDNTRNYGLLDGAGTQRPAYDGYVTGSCAPRAPSNTAATASSSSSITATWTNNSAYASDIKVYNGVTTVILPPTATSYTWTGLAPNTYLCTLVAAENSQGLTWSPQQGCTTTPAASSGVVATPLDSHSIKVTWPDNSSVETGFALSNSVTSVDLPANTTSYVWSGLAPGTYMCFTVTYHLPGGNQTPWSPYGCTTTPH